MDEADEGNNELVRTLEASEQQVRLESIVFEDGRITNKGVVDNGAPFIGDYPDNTAVGGFLSFDLTAIPAGAEILEASLRLGGGRAEWRGDLVFSTDRWFEIYDYAYGSLDPGDYDGGPAERVTGFDPQKLEPIDLTELVQEKVDAGAERLQLRMQMSNETDNDDTGDRVTGCGPIVAIDIDAGRLELARELGATHTMNGAEIPDVVTAIRDVSDGGMDYGLDTTSNPVVFRQVVDVLKMLGTCGLIGGMASGTEVRIEANHLLPSRTVRGVSAIVSSRIVVFRLAKDAK